MKRDFASTGIIFNLIFLAFILLFEKQLSEETYKIIELGEKNALLGIFWLVLFVLESFAFVIRLLVIVDKLGANFDWDSVPRWFAWGYICRMLLAGTFTLAIAHAFGIGDTSWVGVILVLYLLFREVFALGFFLVFNTWINRRFTIPRLLKSPVSMFLINLTIFLFSILAFSAYWGFIVAKNDLLSGGITIFNFLGGTLFFLIAYVATRFVYLVEEYYFAKSRYERFMIFFTTAVLIIVTVRQTLR